MAASAVMVDGAVDVVLLACDYRGEFAPASEADDVIVGGEAVLLEGVAVPKIAVAAIAVGHKCWVKY